jgi:hypothetical protein
MLIISEKRRDTRIMKGFPKHYTGDELNRADQSSSTGKWLEKRSVTLTNPFYFLQSLGRTEIRKFEISSKYPLEATPCIRA